MKRRLEIGDWRLETADAASLRNDRSPRSPGIHARAAADHQPPPTVCSPQGHCTTCSDEVQRARVLRVDGERFMAHADLQGQTVDIDISLVPAVQEGDVLLVHGGVALERERHTSNSAEDYG